MTRAAENCVALLARVDELRAERDALAKRARLAETDLRDALDERNYQEQERGAAEALLEEALAFLEYDVRSEVRAWLKRDAGGREATPCTRCGGSGFAVTGDGLSDSVECPCRYDKALATVSASIGRNRSLRGAAPISARGEDCCYCGATVEPVGDHECRAPAATGGPEKKP